MIIYQIIYDLLFHWLFAGYWTVILSRQSTFSMKSSTNNLLYKSILKTWFIIAYTQFFRMEMTVRSGTRGRWLSWTHIRLVIRRLRVWSPPGPATFFCGDCSWNIFNGSVLFMKYFLRSFSSFRCFKKDSCQFLAKECAQYWLTT